MTKEEALATLSDQGHEVTEEEAKALEALLATGKLDEAALDKVVGGLNPKFKKALIAASVLIPVAAGGGYLLTHRKKKESQAKPAVHEGEFGTELQEFSSISIPPPPPFVTVQTRRNAGDIATAKAPDSK